MNAPVTVSQVETDPRRRLLIAVAVMSCTVMQVLDTTIVNVALPHMKGQLGATPDQISWVLTSYIVASGIFMPLTGYLSDRFGQRRYLLISILGFTLTSVLCGLATSLSAMVLFRLLQGVFGAALVPLAQSILVQVYPLKDRGRVMAIWSMGVMVGPILGPALGGWLTEMLSWRWTFFINLPIGLASAVIAWQVIPDTPRRARRMDWSGFLLLVMAVGGVQMVLDRGAGEGWFSSNEIRVLSLIGAVGFIGFFWHCLSRREDPLFDLRMFRDRNFAISCLLLAILGLAMFGSMLVLPLMLESLMHYPATTTGLLMAPRGLASVLSMYIVGHVINRVDARGLIAAGIAIFTVGSYYTTQYHLGVSSGWILLPGVIQGFGMGMVMVPLSAIAYATLPQRYVAEAAGVFSLARTLGSALGISIVATLISRHTQLAWNQLGGGLRVTSDGVSHWLANLGLSPESPEAARLIAMELGRQSTMVAYVDAYQFVAWAFVSMLPLALLFGRRRGSAVTAHMAHEM